MRFYYRAILLLLTATSANAATFTVAGNSLTVATAILQVTFNGPDVVAVTNAMTGESYLRGPSPAMQLNLTLTQPSSASLGATGPWTVNTAATTQQVVVDLDGQANPEQESFECARPFRASLRLPNVLRAAEGGQRSALRLGVDEVRRPAASRAAPDHVCL